MKAMFGIERERHNKLFYKEYKNDKGVFHFHSQIELYFVTEGEMEIYVGNQGRTVCAGEMSVALSYEPHSYKTPESSASKPAPNSSIGTICPRTCTCPPVGR